MGVDDSGHGVGGVVKAVHKLEAESDDERQGEQQIGHALVMTTLFRSWATWNPM